MTLALAYTIADRLAGLAGSDLLPLVDRAAPLTAVCLLILPNVLTAPDRSARGVLLAALAATLAALVLPFLLGRPDSGPQELLAGALMVAVLTFAIGATARLLLPVAGDASTALGWVLATVLVLAAAPLWLAGLLDRGAPIADLLVAVNPLSALGLAGAVDYPRDEWLYRHSPLGSVRYSYPSLWTLFLAYFSAGIVALVLAHRPGARAAGPAPVHSPTNNNPWEPSA